MVFCRSMQICKSYGSSKCGRCVNNYESQPDFFKERADKKILKPTGSGSTLRK